MIFSKKGQIEVQFNWIFILIVGAFILVFFISIVNIQKQAADKKLAFDILGKIDLIISGALTIPKTGQIFDMPKIDFTFQCDRISAFGVDRQFPDRIVFGPDLLRGKQLIIWSQDWNVPYKTANFLYMTTDNVRYVIYYKDSDYEEKANRLLSELPDNLTKEVVSAADFSDPTKFKDKNNYKIRMVFLDDMDDYNEITSLTLPSFMQDNSVTAAKVARASNNVRFFVKKGNFFQGTGNDIPVLGDPMHYGAIFAETNEMFNCSYHKAFDKLVYVSKIYAERERAIDYNYSNPVNPDCHFGSARAFDDIDAIAAEAQSSSVSTSMIEGYMSNIAAANQDNLEKSCAPIY